MLHILYLYCQNSHLKFKTICAGNTYIQITYRKPPFRSTKVNEPYSKFLEVLTQLLEKYVIEKSKRLTALEIHVVTKLYNVLTSDKQKRKNI